MNIKSGNIETNQMFMRHLTSLNLQCLKHFCRAGYQQQDGEEAIKDVVPVGQVSSPAERKDLHTHFKQVVQDEAQVDDLTGGQQRSEVSYFVKKFMLTIQI